MWLYETNFPLDKFVHVNGKFAVKSLEFYNFLHNLSRFWIIVVVLRRVVFVSQNVDIFWFPYNFRYIKAAL